VVEARRRSIRNLIAVAGPTSAGKSTFVRRLLADNTLREKLSLPAGNWIVVKGKDVASLPAGQLQNVLVEFDLLSVSRAEVQSCERNPSFHILQTAENALALTVIPPAGRLNEQMRDKEIKRLYRKACVPMTRALLALYQGTGGQEPIRALYKTWIDYALRNGIRREQQRLVVNTFHDYVIEPLDKFDTVFDSIHGR
jgi:hypothetical protein